MVENNIDDVNNSGENVSPKPKTVTPRVTKPRTAAKKPTNGRGRPKSVVNKPEPVVDDNVTESEVSSTPEPVNNFGQPVIVPESPVVEKSAVAVEPPVVEEEKFGSGTSSTNLVDETKVEEEIFEKEKELEEEKNEYAVREAQKHKIPEELAREIIDKRKFIVAAFSGLLALILIGFGTIIGLTIASGMAENISTDEPSIVREDGVVLKDEESLQIWKEAYIEGIQDGFGFGRSYDSTNTQLPYEQSYPDVSENN